MTQDANCWENIYLILYNKHSRNNRTNTICLKSEEKAKDELKENQTLEQCWANGILSKGKLYTKIEERNRFFSIKPKDDDSESEDKDEKTNVLNL